MFASFQSIQLVLNDVTLLGDLTHSPHATGVVVFSHGSGSSRLSSRNRAVTQLLQAAGLATLLFDLLSPAENQTYATRFDIVLLTRRLLGVAHWMTQQPTLAGLRLGFFGASTGAASALGAAAELGSTVGAVVSRGGRPDLALPVLHRVRAPTLLLVGSNDGSVIALNEQALRVLGPPSELRIIPGAGHLFEEPGTLEQVADATAAWFSRYLS